MKQSVEKRKPSSILDYVALGLTTWGVGYIPGAPGTYGSVIGVGIYLSVESFLDWLRRLDPKFYVDLTLPSTSAVIAITIVGFCLLGIWASTHSISLLGNDDPSEAVVDEVMGQLITFIFVGFGIGWPFVFAGFLLFRLFDIWKPFPIDDLQVLPGGLGICADDIVAGVYAGVCLSAGYAIYLAYLPV